MGFKIDDRVARPLFMDDGTWLQEGDVWRLSTDVPDGRIGGLARIAMAMPTQLWRQWVEDHLSDLDRGRAVQELEWSIEMAVRAMGYIKVRANGGDHTAGVRKSNGWGTRVRRMLGCTHPKQDMEF